MKSSMFDSTKMLLPKRLVLTYSLIAKAMHYQILFYRNEIELLVLSYVQFYLGNHFPSELWLLIREGKVNHLT